MSKPSILSSAATGDWAAHYQACARHVRHPSLRAFYQAGLPAPQTPVEDLQMVALDVETTGLDPRKDSIVSIGLLPFTLDRIRCAQARYWVIRPGSELSDESVTFHHITHSEVRQAPSLASVLPDLLAAMAGKVAVVHYRPIERQFLDHAMQRYCAESWQFPVIDTMQLEARRHRQRRSWLDWLCRRQPASLRLADSRERYHLAQYKAHHALTDALATAELLQAQLAHHPGDGVACAQLWV